MPHDTAKDGDDDPFLAGLNAAQRRAVSTTSDCVAILAGPGCGKTHTLTSRVAYLIGRLGYQPSNIIVATFTVKAAREMRERIGRMVGEDRQRKIVLGTFHGVAARYLSIYGHLIGMPKKFGIIGSSDAREVVKRIIKRLELKMDPGSALGHISREKSRGIPDSPSAENSESHFSGGSLCSNSFKEASNSARAREYKRVYDEYQARLEEMGVVDFDDLLLRCVQLLQQHPKCVSNIEAVLIDEYQDTNTTQYELMKLFASARKRITIVGDPDQSIYAWRSAEIKNLQRLLDQYPGTEEISLEENYRSSTKIIESSLKVITQDKDRYEKNLVSVHKPGTKPVLRHLKSSSDQAGWVAQEIGRICNMTGNTIKWKDVAVLMRLSSASRLIETALTNEGIRYCMMGGSRFYDRVEIKLILDYLAVIKVPTNNEALSHIINVPKRNIGPVTIRNLLESAETTHKSLWDIINSHIRADFPGKPAFNKPQQRRVAQLTALIQTGQARLRNGTQDTEFDLVSLIQYVIDAIDLKDHLKKTFKDDFETRWSNVEELLRGAREFVDDFDYREEELPEIEGVEQTIHLDMLDRFLANASMVSGYKETDDESDDKGAVTLSTIHAAKGLEWPVVFVPNVQSGAMPFTRYGGEVNFPEERRLLYVAMTRAKALLYLSYLEQDRIGEGSEFSCTLSEFLTEAKRTFAPYGPSFTAKVLSELASILRREFPSVDAVYKALPPMVSTEDDSYRLKATGGRRRSSITADDDEDHEYGSHKRMRSSFDPRTVNAGRWNPRYSTTMDQSANFTMGFVSASSLPVQPDKPRAGSAAKGAGAGAKGAQKPASGQTRLVPSASRPSHTMARTTMANAVQYPPLGSANPTLAKENYKGTGARKLWIPPPVPAIVSPALQNHKLGQPHTAEELKKVQKAAAKSSDGFAQAHKYPQFSSSPPRAESFHSTNRHSAHNTSPGTGQSASEAIVLDNDDDDDDGPVEPAQPAQTLHKTTMTTSFGGFHRPAGINRLSGPDTMGRIQRMGRPPPRTTATVNKPFKMPVKREVNKGKK